MSPQASPHPGSRVASRSRSRVLFHRVATCPRLHAWPTVALASGCPQSYVVTVGSRHSAPLFFLISTFFFLTHSKCVETLAVLCLPTIGGKKIYTNLLIDQVLLDCYPSYRTQRSHYDPWFLEYYLTDYQLPSSLYIIHLFGQLTAESRPDQSSDDVVASFGTPTTGSDVYVCTVNIDFPPFEKFSSDRISRK